MAAVTVPRLPLHLDVDQIGRTNNVLHRFKENRGQDLVYELLRKAEFQGRWTLRLLEAFKSSGDTPSVRIKRADRSGVIMHLKPGSNDSGVKALLMVTRDHGEPEDVLKKLLAVAGEAADPVALTSTVMGGVIGAVHDLNARMTICPKENYVGTLFDRIRHAPVWGMEFPNAYALADVLDDLVEAKYLYADGHGNAYKVGRLGIELLYRNQPADATDLLDEPPPVAEETPVAPPVAPSPVPVPTQVPTPGAAAPATTVTDPLQLIIAYKGKLERLIQIPALVETIRARRREVLTEVERLSAELAKLDGEERQLLSVDTEALHFLFGSEPGK